MASLVLSQTPWTYISRLRMGFNTLDLPSRFRSSVGSKTFFSSPHLGTETPAMIAMRQHSYPTSTLDPLVFEDMTEEYTARTIQPASSSVREHCNSQSLLQKLVEADRFSDAARVRDELKDMGIPIEESVLYARPIPHSLNAQEGTYEEKAADFMAWWSLMPFAYRKLYVNSALMRNTFFKDSTPNIPLIVRCAISLAASGLANRSARLFIPIIVRNSHPDLTLAFMEHLKKADLQYHQRRRKSLRWAASDMKLHEINFARLYALAMRNHCAAGRLTAAVALIRSALRLGLPITDSTFAYLSPHLQRAHDEEGVALVESWQNKQRRMRDDTEVRVPQSPRDGTSSQEKPIASSSRHPYVHYTEAFGSLLLKRSPTPREFKVFLDFYGFQDPEYLLYFRKTVLRMRPRAQVLSSWLYAELSSLVEHSYFDDALLLFGSNFWTIGAPAWVLTRIQELNERSPFVVRKLWPTSLHLSLIWRVAISQTTNHTETEKLYQEFLALASVRVTEGLEVAVIDSGRHSDAGAREAPVQFDGVCFSHFIGAFVDQGVILRAMHIPADMARLEVPVITACFRALVKGISRLRTFGRVVSLIRKLDERASRPKQARVPVMNSLEVSENPHTLVGLPHPLIAVYLAAIIRFQQNGQEEQAAAITLRLKEQCQKLDFDVDAVLDKLRHVHYKDKAE